MKQAVLLLLTFLPGFLEAFQLLPRQTTNLFGSQTTHVPTRSALKHNENILTILQMSAGEEGEEASDSPKRRRRRKRKVEVGETEASDEEEPESVTPTIELKPRDESPVQLQVVDVRDAVGRPSSSPEQAASAPFSTSTSAPAATGAAPSTTSSSPAPAAGGSIDDSLKQLLEDARQMQEEDSEASPAEGDGSIKATIRNALGTIVTADFFVVCGFLLWFLLGIFCSSVLKDDTVQIAFNSTYALCVMIVNVFFAVSCG